MQTIAPLQQQTDEDLARLVAQQNENSAAAGTARDAFAELYQRHSPWLLSVLSARVHRNDLEDAHQVVWQRVWSRAETGFRGGRFQVWLYHIARNHVIDCSRRLSARPMGEFAETVVSPGSEAVEDRLEQAESMEILRDCIGRLGGRAAQVVRLRLEGRSFSQICEQLQITRKRAYRLMHEARAALTASVARACV